MDQFWSGSICLPSSNNRTYNFVSSYRSVKLPTKYTVEPKSRSSAVYKLIGGPGDGSDYVVFGSLPLKILYVILLKNPSVWILLILSPHGFCIWTIHITDSED